MLLTYFLAQLMGVFCVIVGLFVLLRRRTFIEIVHDIEHNQPLIISLGLISVLLGLLLVLTHDFWFGGLLSVLVTLIGWVMLIRGLLAIFVPQRFVLKFLKWLHVEKLYWLYGTIILVIGLYMVVAGF